MERARILWYLCAMVGNQHDAEDLTQEVFVRALRAWPSFRGDAPASAWLFAIAVNGARDFLRHRVVVERVVEEAASEALSAVPEPGDPEHQARMSAVVQSALSALPRPDREVLTLFFFEERSCREIAALVGCSRAAVKVRLLRARRKMATLLGHAQEETV